MEIKWLTRLQEGGLGNRTRVVKWVKKYGRRVLSGIGNSVGGGGKEPSARL